MILGAYIEDASDAMEVREELPRRRQSNPVWDGVFYFVYHPKTRMYQVFSDEDRAILSSSVKSLLRRGISAVDLRKAIDRFYASEFAMAERPALYFAIKPRQEDIIQDMSFLSHKDSIQRFRAFGFERNEDMDLPWSKQWDCEIKQRCIDCPEESIEIMKEYCGAF